MFRIIKLFLFLFPIVANAVTFDGKYIDEVISVDFANSLSLEKKDNKEALLEMRKIAKDFAKQKGFHSQPMIYDSVSFVMNPVVNNKNYKHLFRFNLKSKSDSEMTSTCVAVTDKKLDNYRAGCYINIK